ncbi:hypothetical protein VTN77DRAFT_125 [Rasamsonia byssochlamydoides]|uniref:uncharacterized protein n=1 Tax=Rasamsonia byssochlamydoides TaxID=89139 RepID=UPI003743BA6C
MATIWAGASRTTIGVGKVGQPLTNAVKQGKWARNVAVADHGPPQFVVSKMDGLQRLYEPAQATEQTLGIGLWGHGSIGGRASAHSRWLLDAVRLHPGSLRAGCSGGLAFGPSLTRSPA